MTKEKEDTLISQKEAAAILGFKQTYKITEYIKAGILTKFEKPGSKRIWICKKQVLQLPKPLPVPPPEDVFRKLKINERWKKEKEDSSDS
jgi:hypothetical protein